MSPHARVVSEDVQVASPYGLHARVACEIVKRSQEFESRILIIKGEEVADGKSILEIMTLGAECGALLTVRACGRDADEAVRAIATILQETDDSVATRPAAETSAEA